MRWLIVVALLIIQGCMIEVQALPEEGGIGECCVCLEEAEEIRWGKKIVSAENCQATFTSGQIPVVSIFAEHYCKKACGYPNSDWVDAACFVKKWRMEDCWEGGKSFNPVYERCLDDLFNVRDEYVEALFWYYLEVPCTYYTELVKNYIKEGG